MQLSLSMKQYSTVLETSPIDVGARSSKLSIKQIEEVVEAISYHHPHLHFRCFSCKTLGDKDQKTSLRELEKTNFFTKEVDQWLLNEKIRIAVHSAKDLPDPLPEGLEIVAVTAPVDSKDVIVFNPGLDPKKLPSELKIATSSLNREKNVKNQLPHAQVVDLRGTIDQRIQQVMDRKVEGVVIAKVALMRLGYKDLNMVELVGETTPMQGSLAILARKDDLEMKDIFSAIDFRRGQKSLYTGLNISRYRTQGTVVHYPLIQIKPYPIDQFKDMANKLSKSSHLLLSSQTSVKILFEIMKAYQIPSSLLDSLQIIAVGQTTANSLQSRGGYASYIAQDESQEGLIELFKKINWKRASHLFYPRSARARNLLNEHLDASSVSYEALDLYDSQPFHSEPKPKLREFDEIVFTSPLGVKSFFETFGELPEHLRVICKGRVTKSALEKHPLSCLAAPY